MASGHVNRTQRPNTWLHRPSLRREDSPCQLGAVHTWPKATDIATRRFGRFWWDCVAKLLLRRLANDDSVGLRRASAGAAHDGSAGRRTGPVLLFLLTPRGGARPPSGA